MRPEKRKSHERKRKLRKNPAFKSGEIFMPDEFAKSASRLVVHSALLSASPGECLVIATFIPTLLKVIRAEKHRDSVAEPPDFTENIQ